MMKTVTLYTEKYEHKLRDFIEQASIMVRGQGFLEPLYYFRCVYEPKDARFFESLAHFLEGIVLHENPICRNSAKLQHAAHTLRSATCETKEQLKQYLRQYKSLHIEGYTAFRMDGFRYKLDIMMVGLIRKLKLT